MQSDVTVTCSKRCSLIGRFSRIWIKKLRQVLLRQARRGNLTHGGGHAIEEIVLAAIRNRSQTVNIARTERGEGGSLSILAGFSLAHFFEWLAVLRFP